ncbi:MAG TPA: DUF29 domain-containing protein [Candidatus Limnocylindria bacterium]|nr:DUF29 domain-containing protein [Candidatus Limnocylindria bacterium]
MTTGTRADLIDRPQREVTREEDFVAWARGQAALLRRGELETVDREGVAEELEDMTKRERRELESRLKILLQHLLKWEFQPQRRSRSWLLTIREQRNQLGKLLRDSPSLKNDVAWAIEENYSTAAGDAAVETRMPRGAFPPLCPYPQADVLDPGFLPGPPADDEKLL